MRNEMKRISAAIVANSADTVQERADLAVEELERTGAFDREIVVVATSTGTGWIDPDAADKAVEVAMALAPLFADQDPQLVPSDGGVCVEWHTHGWTVEVYVENRNV